MKKIKLFPAPHVEIRIHVSEEMERDYWACKANAMKKPGEELPCVGCSWEDVCIGNVGACEMQGLEEQMGGISGETDGKER